MEKHWLYMEKHWIYMCMERHWLYMEKDCKTLSWIDEPVFAAFSIYNTFFVHFCEFFNSKNEKKNQLIQGT